MIYVFGDCPLDTDRHELHRAGQGVALEPKVFQVLLYLLQHRDRIVTKDDLFAHCWPGTFVSEAALTRCLAKVRQAVQAGRTGAPVIKTIHRQGYRSMNLRFYRLKGVLCLALSSDYQAEAETYFRQALDIARDQHAKALELRVAVSLSQLWQQQGKRDAARDLLTPVYGWFTEGFGTPDLQEARMLLDELA